jgi:nucleoside phosphorylase/tetratricopeptide (TPR) repeat protein
MPGPRPQPVAGQPRRAVILTALRVEYEAVKAHLSDCREAPHPQGNIYEKGTFLSPSGDWEILIAEIDPGNPSAAFEAERAITFFEPEVALFIGVAGGLKDVALGDVVAATLAHGYESGKAAKEFLPRDDPFRSTFRIRERAKSERKKDNWRSRIKDPAFASPPKVLVGPICAGEKVVASKRSAIYKFLRATYSDAVAVEMEGVGFLRATYANPGLESLVIRGISDLISKKNLPDEAERQDTASRHAAAFAFEVLAKFEIPPEREKLRPEIIWNVPHSRNPNFTGRDELLKKLREALTSGQATALTQAALHGLGGVGKTQLALEYSYRFARDYYLVWWVRSEDPVALAAEYAALAGALELPEKGAAEQELAVAAVRQWLSQNGQWLLIFDNAGERQDLKGYIPQGGGGHVLITSRNPVWRGMARPLDVKVWERDESVAFLLKRTGQEKTAGPEEKAAADELANELGDLPLALEQAGAYIEECGDTIGHYLELFRTRRQELLKRGKLSQDYPDTVATTWELSFQKAQAASPEAAADLLNLCAFLAPDDIPKKLLEQGAAHLPKFMAAAIQDPVKFDDALAILRRYSLMEVSNDALAEHRLVQAVVRDRLDKKGKEKWAGALVDLLGNVYSGDFHSQINRWPWRGRLLPHTLAVAGHAENFQVALLAAGQLLNQAGFYLRFRAEFIAAKNCYARALAIDEAAYGSNHPAVAIRVNNLGRVLKDLGDLPGAKAKFERAFVIDEAAYGPNHPNVATAVNNLGSVLRALGDLSGAKAKFERALAINEAAYGPDHPEVAIAANNLGIVFKALGDLPGARARLERAVAILRQFLGEDHPDTKLVKDNLAALG